MPTLTPPSSSPLQCVEAQLSMTLDELRQAHGQDQMEDVIASIRIKIVNGSYNVKKTKEIDARAAKREYTMSWQLVSWLLN